MKKWSYVAALMLTAASGLALTSCIDNDEPYGIQQIRLATANLLEAKKAAIVASEAAQQAQIEIEKIKAEAARLQAENQKILNEAEAKIKEAQAKAIELQAQADAAKTEAEAAIKKAEAAKYEAEALQIKAETDAYIASQKALLDEFIAQAEIRVKTAQQEYDEAVYKFQQQQIKDAALANDNLYKAWALAFQAYLDQLAEVNTLNADYLEAQKEYAMAAIDLVPDGHGGWISQKYDALKALEKTVADLKKEIQQQKDDIDFYNEYIAALQNFQSTDQLYQLFDKYNAEKEANEKALADANVELASLAIENKGLYDSRKELTEEFNAYRTTQAKEIPAYTWEPNSALAGIGLSKPEIVVAPGESFTLEDTNNYDNAYYEYNRLIDKLKKYLLDANDVEWTNARINEMTRLLGYYTNSYDEAVENWKTAKTAYNMGNTPDYSVIPMEADVQAALSAYEAEASKCGTLRQAKIDADAAVEATAKTLADERDAFNKNPDSQANKYIAIAEAYREANNTASETRNAAYAKANADYNKAYQAATDAQTEAWRKVDKANLDLIEAINNGAPAAEIEKLQQAYDKAEEDANNQDTKTQTDIQTATTAREKAYTAAGVAYERARLAAREKYEKDYKAWQAAGGDLNESTDPAAAKVRAAIEANNKALENQAKVDQEINDFDNSNSVLGKFWELYTAFSLQSNAVGGWNINNIWTLLDELDAFLNGSKDVTEFPTTFLPSHLENEDAVYINVKQYLINKSRIAYGNLGMSIDEGGYDIQDPENIWDIDEAFLVDEVTPEMLNAYIAEMYPWMDEFDYPDYYDSLFGWFGKKLALENRIEVAKAMVANQALLPDAIKPLEENLKTLEGLMADLMKGEEELSDKMNAVNDQITALEADATAKITELKHWISVYDYVLADITKNIGMLLGEPTIDGSESINDIFENSISLAQEFIAVCNNRIEGLNDLLARAEYQLEEYKNNEGTINVNPVAIRVDAAKAALDAANEKLAFLDNRAKELQAKYEAANK